MKTEYQAPRAVAEIGAVYVSLTPKRDPMLKLRLAFWIDRFGDKLLADLSPDDIDGAQAELETAPGPKGKLRSGPAVNRYRMAIQGCDQIRQTEAPAAAPHPARHRHRATPGRLAGPHLGRCGGAACAAPRRWIPTWIVSR